MIYHCHHDISWWWCSTVDSMLTDGHVRQTKNEGDILKEFAKPDGR